MGPCVVSISTSKRQNRDRCPHLRAPTWAFSCSRPARVDLLAGRDLNLRPLDPQCGTSKPLACGNRESPAQHGAVAAR